MDYIVNYEDRLNNGTQMAFGHIDFDEATIKLTPNLQSKQGECQTILHEVLHGIANHFDLKINDDEDTINKLARGMYMVMVDNPDIFTS